MKNLNKNFLLKLIFGYVMYLFVVWSSFRLFISLPEVIEELWFKPIVWLVPVFWIWWLTDKKVDFFGGSLFKSVFLGFGLGGVYLILIYFLIGFSDFNFDWNKLGVGFVTAVVENLVFAGFLLPIFAKKWGSFNGLMINAVLFSLIHLPIAIFSYRVDIVSLLGLFLLTFSIGVMNGWVRLKSKNVAGAIVASWLWVFASL
jgi:membrane protease YdiL (CAAX protease family)